MTASLRIKVDNLSALVKGLKSLVGKEVLVGVPEDKSQRDSNGNHIGPANNATLAYIHDNGAPASNIPARPFMRPGINAVRERITSRMQSAVKAALDGHPEKVDAQLEAVGLIAATSIKKTINDGDGFTPLLPSTVAARYRGRGAKRPRKSELAYAALIASGQTPGDAQTAAGIKPLIDTGQLRNSITYVVRDK